MPFWVTLTAEPIAVPPVLQSVGAAACGPNTWNENVPESEEPPDRSTEIELAEIAEPDVPDDGAVTAPSDGEAGPTLVSVIAPPQPELVPLLLESPS